jgi:protein O-GlcNAc transferase
MIKEYYREQINEIILFINQKNLFQAKNKIENLIKKYPEDLFLENVYGTILLNLEHIDSAISIFEILIKKNPDNSIFYFNLATCYKKKNLIEKTIENLLIALEKNNNYYNAYYELGKIFQQKKVYDVAIKHYKKAIKTDPSQINSYMGLVSAYIDSGNLKEAKNSCNIAFSVNPNDANVFYNFAYLNLLSWELDEGIENIKKSIILKGEKTCFEEFNLLGVIYTKKNLTKYSQIYFEKSLDINPNYEPAIKNLALLYINRGLYEDSIKLIENKINQMEDLYYAYSILGLGYFNLLELKKGIDFFEKSLNAKFTETTCRHYLFYSLYINDFSREKYFNLTHKLRDFLKQEKLIGEFKNLKKINKYNKKIRVGFNGDFKEHVIIYQILAVIEHLSHSNDIELVAYNNSSVVDKFTEKLKSKFYLWRDIYFYKDNQALEIIRNDQLDIFIDLQGHSGENSRYKLIIERSAPIQISWCGFLDSMGFPEIDYIIADPYVVDKSEEKKYSEKIIYMPNIWSSLDTRLININSEKLVSKNKNFIAFGSVSNPLKINDGVLRVWSEILRQRDNSKLLLTYKSYNILEIKKKIISFFYKEKISQERIIFKVPKDREDFLASYLDIDIILDTFPYSGMTTNLEAAWMGIPTLTLKGDTFLSKCGVSVNMNLKMQDWIAKDELDYIKKAIFFSSNIKDLESYKNKLLKDKMVSKIFDSKEFANNLIILFRDLVSKIN